MHFKRMGLGPASISDAVYIELVATLYGSLMPVTILLTGMVLAGAVIIWQTGDLVMIGTLTTLAVAIGAIRVQAIVSFRRCVARRPLGYADACCTGAATWGAASPRRSSSGFWSGEP
jgi:diguanylate cyclase